MNSLKALMLFLLVSVVCPNANADNFIVFGAGSSEVNGLYVENGTYNGQPKYDFVNASGQTYSIVFDCQGDYCSGWYINRDMFPPFGIFNSDPLYENSNQGAIAPTSEWEVYAGGAGPEPTVAYEAAAIFYNVTTFYESMSDDGSISNVSTVTYNQFGGDALTGTNGDDFLLAGKAIVTNLPLGLTATLIRTSASALTLTLTGNASSHFHSDDVNNITLEFADAAFVSGFATGVLNYRNNNLSIIFIQNHTVASSGADFTSIANAVSDAGTLDYDVISIAAGTYTEQGIYINHTLTIRGAGADLTIIQANAAYNTATDRVFNIPDGLVYVKMYDLTIQNGNHHQPNGYGGGIFCESPLELYNCVVRNNIAHSTNNNLAWGGGICFDNFDQSLVLDGCQITGNLCENELGGQVQGGGVLSMSPATITNCTFSGNIASTISGSGGEGGGIHIEAACTFIDRKSVV